MITLDTFDVDCECGAAMEVRDDEVAISRPLQCAACGRWHFWRYCEECDQSFILRSEDAPCPECTPVPRPEGAPPYRPWRLFAVKCPWCGDPFNYLRSAEGYLHKCPHCAKWSSAPMRPWVGVALLAMLAGGAWLGRAVRPSVPEAWRGAFAGAGAVLLLTCAVYCLGRAVPLKRHSFTR